MAPMSATERAREAVARALAPTLYGGEEYRLTNADRLRADMALSALTSLPLPDRLALLLSPEERAAWAVVPRYPTVQMMVAGSDHVGEEDGGGDSLKAWRAMIAASEAARVG